MSTTAQEYRRWLWAYPPSWRDRHGDAVTGILAESAAAGARPGALDWLNLTRSGLAARVRAYGAGFGERGAEARALLRCGLSQAAAPAIVAAVVLLVVDLANGLAGTRPSTGYAANIDSIWWTPTEYAGSREVLAPGLIVLLAAVLALVTSVSGDRRITRFACAAGAAVGILTWLARLLAGQGYQSSALAPAPDTALVAGTLLALGVALPAHARTPQALATHRRATRGLLAFGVGAGLLLGFDSGLFGGTIDIGALNSNAWPASGAALTSCLLLFAAAWYVAAASDRVGALIAVTVLAICWRAGLSVITRGYLEVVAGRMLLEGAVVLGLTLLAVVLVARQPTPQAKEAP